MRRVLVLGNATIDIVLEVDRLPAPGETLLAGGILRCAGGKGLNQAIAAARAGSSAQVRTSLIASIGDDADAAYLRSVVEREACGLTAQWLVTDLPTDVSTIWVAPSGQNTIVSSAACARALPPSQVPELLVSLAPGDLLLLQGNLTAPTSLAAMRRGRASGAQIVLNTAPIDWDMREAVALADVVIANEPEALALTGAEADAAVRALQAFGPAVAVLTRGEHGALVAEGQNVTAIPAPKVVAVDAAGAGDVMVGALAAELAARRPVTEAVALAVAAASLSVTRRGTVPSFPTSSEIESLRARIETRR